MRPQCYLMRPPPQCYLMRLLPDAAAAAMA